MNNLYWIYEWAKIKQGEVVRLPDEIIVHQDFLKHINKEDFVSAFRQIWEMFVFVYADIAENPEAYGMPLYKRDEYDYFSPQVRESRSAPYRFFNLLYDIFTSGEMDNNEFILDVYKFKGGSKVKKMQFLFERLQDNGFEITGIKNFKIPKGIERIAISYPDNHHILAVLKLMAVKAENVSRLHDFLVCHYKLFKDGLTTANYGNGADIVADQMHTEYERSFIYALDEKLNNLGYFAHERSWNEGLGYAYYATEKVMKARGAYHFWLLSWKSTLRLYLRIRNVSKCLEYLQKCPDSVKQIFLQSDEGCGNRYNGSCKCGISYSIGKVSYWRCGCCSAPFYLEPKMEDILHYLELIELGAIK